MIYACEKCHFIFERIGAVDACPDCGKPSLREADERERDEFRRRTRRLGSEPGTGSLPPLADSSEE
ncbi:MAG: hypothetical protein LBT32_06815 [Peptococcaceae bacterium]|jgi:hypothetical protein|nr:hypothetical protein [Peptococcaceae bacterium]